MKSISLAFLFVSALGNKSDTLLKANRKVSELSDVEGFVPYSRYSIVVP